MLKRLLIVDDVKQNRLILREILRKDFDLVEAKDGEQALDVLRTEGTSLSAVLLDIGLPGIDGFEVLRRIRLDERLAELPVIMITGNESEESRVASLAEGANDYVTKPYNSEVIRHCLRNHISFHEAAVTVAAAKRDKLTGLYNREAFFETAAAMIGEKPAGHYIIACLDIDNFKVINDRHGSEKGDEVLKALAATLLATCAADEGVCGRISADNFVVLRTRAFAEHNADIPTVLAAGILEKTGLDVSVSLGRYYVEDKNLSISSMYDRAKIAQATVKGRHDGHAAIYRESMRENILHTQEIVTNMRRGLTDEQFEVWYQPQYNHSKGTLIGAEALVRWRHPKHGLIPPIAFIPIFEQNGFIYDLDKYVWEKVCQSLARWMEEGRKPLPVSVNISRYDILRPDLVELLSGLVKRYHLPVALLRLEVTESAFSQDAGKVISTVKELIDLGFTVEIDDFGSGYSSLNTLKDVPAQIIKLDMKFLESSTDSQRGGNIVESIVRMAKWLGMLVIAEGVEDKAQADYLRSIGCSYMQGYYFARPIQLEGYEKLCRSASKETELLFLETVENLDNNAFWDPHSMDTLIFNSYVGAACIFEYSNGNIELLRYSQEYERRIASIGLDMSKLITLNWSDYLDEENAIQFREALERSKRDLVSVKTEVVLKNLTHQFGQLSISFDLRVIASAGARYLVYCTYDNLTAQREAERKLRESAEEMRTLMNDTPGGFARMRVEPDGSGHTEYVNDGFCRMLGMTFQEVIDTYSKNLMLGVHPDDLPALMEQYNSALATYGLLNAKYRLQTKSGAYVWTQAFARFTKADDGGTVINCYYVDLSEQEKQGLSIRETTPFILSTIMNASPNLDFAKDKNFNYIYCSPGFVKFTRQKTQADVIGRNDYDFWTKEEADHFRADDVKLFESGESLVEYTEPIPSDDGVQHYSITSKHILRDSTGEIIGLYGSGRDVTDVRSAFDQLKLLTDSIPGGIATYAVSPEGMRITYFNDGFLKMLGYTHEQYDALSKTSVNSRVFPEDLPGLMAQVQAMYDHGTPINYTYRTKGAYENGCIWVHFRGELAERVRDTCLFNAVLYDVTKQQNILERLRVSELENDLAIKQGGNIVCRYAIADRSLTVSREMAATYSIPETQLDVPDEPIRMGMISEETAHAYKGFFEAIRNGSEAGTVLFQQRYQGDWRWMEAKSTTIFSESGQPVKAVISMFDVTERLQKETVFRKWHQSLTERAPESYTLFLFNLNHNLSYETKEGELFPFDIDSMNGTFNERSRAYAEAYVDADDRERYLALVNSDYLLASYYRGSRAHALEYRELLPGDAHRWIKLSIELVESPTSTDVEAFLMYEDIDTAKRAELQTKALSETDPLTGILNRTAFAAKVEAILQAAKPGARHALLMLDIDGFKQVNDVFGHRTGDKTLVDIADILLSTIRESDLAGRLGGDEFVVFLHDVSDAMAVIGKARQICSLMRISYSMEVQISVSIGIAIAPHDGDTFNVLYQKADAALYYVKGSGKDNVAVYREDFADEHLTPEEDAPGADGGRPADKKRRMLIVDDSAIDHLMLRRIFEDEFIVEKARDGNSALIRLRHYGSAISVVLLDLMMPGMDGFAVLKKMQESVELRSIPVIIVSGDESRETCLKAIRDGATDFVTKPVDADLLHLRVQSAVSKAENERLRAMNSLLELQNEDRERYNVVLEHAGITFVEHNWHTGAFYYYPTISKYLAGRYDHRQFWQILLSDMVADTQTVQLLQHLVYRIASSKEHTEGSLNVRLKTPQNKTHTFRVHIHKLTNEYQLTNRLLLSLNDLDY